MELQAACCSRQQFVTSGSNFGASHLLTCLEVTTASCFTNFLLDDQQASLVSQSANYMDF
jgi:hypothetical protein